MRAKLSGRQASRSVLAIILASMMVLGAAYGVRATGGRANAWAAPLEAGQAAGPDAGKTAGSDAGQAAGADAGQAAGRDAGQAGEPDAGQAAGPDAWQTGGSIAPSEVSPLAAGTSFPLAQAKVSDPDTSNINSKFSANTIENGVIWTDKTVNKDQAVVKALDGSVVATVDTADSTDFTVELSALSQGYSVKTVTSPSDVVFILDVSNSMVLNKLPNGQTRAAAMVDALNNAIKMLMSANPDNRIAVVAYGGDYTNRNIARKEEILPLGRYDISGNCFNISGNPPGSVSIRVNSNITTATTSSVRVLGGTPTQLGMYTGAQVLMGVDNTDDVSGTRYTDTATNTVLTRRPSIILLTDGDPTFAWTDYTMASATPTNFEHGNGMPSDMGMDVLNVMTASYWKEQVSQHYYGAGTQEATVYTIGVNVTNNNALTVLDPAANASSDTQYFAGNGTTYNAADILNSFIASPGTAQQFPAVVNTPDGQSTLGLSLVTVANSAAPAAGAGVANSSGIVTSYDYTDGFYPSSNSDALNEAFRDIAQNIITSGAYSTNTGNDDPNFTGNLVFKDVFGQGFEFKEPHGFFINDTEYNGATLANELVNNQGGAAYNKYLTVLENRLGITTAQAAALIDSCIANGDVNYHPQVGIYGTRLSWYADDGLAYLESFYDATGAVQPAPADATCIVALFSVEGEVTDPVTSKTTDLMYLYFELVTALGAGVFTAPNAHNTQFNLEPKQQAALWYVPASLIPQRTVRPVYDATLPSQVNSIAIEERSPIRVLYTVGLLSDFSLASFSSLYKRVNGNGSAGAEATGYYFYTNDWRNPMNTSDAYFSPNISNPYYFYTGDSGGDGKSYLYVQDTSGTSPSGYVQASSYNPGTQYYTEFQYFDSSAASGQGAHNYLVTSYVPVNASTTAVSTVGGAGGAPYIAYGTARVPDTSAPIPKSANATASSDSSFNAGFSANGLIEEQFLGNNGRLEVLFTNVAVEKYWEPAGANDGGVWVKLYQDTGAFGAMPTDRNPLHLEAANNWRGEFTELMRYSLTPVNGALPLVVYSVLEGQSTDGTDFISWGTGGMSPNGEFKISFIQPAWDSASGTWSTAEIANILKPFLIIEKRFVGLPAEVYPADLEFEITGVSDTGIEIFHRVANYSEFRRGRLILGQLTPGTYTVVEKSGTAEVEGYVLLGAEPAQGASASIIYGSEETVVFTNTYEPEPTVPYTPIAPPGSARPGMPAAGDASAGLAVAAVAAALAGTCTMLAWTALRKRTRRQLRPPHA